MTAGGETQVGKLRATKLSSKSSSNQNMKQRGKRREHFPFKSKLLIKVKRMCAAFQEKSESGIN